MNDKITGHNWITAIANKNPDLAITRLAIPGTHDTMTASCKHEYYCTQYLELSEQLETGIRFLDLRLRANMVAAHREWISDITTDEIFNTLGEFLAHNPQEFIIVRIQNANENKDDFPAYAAALQDKIAKHRELFYSWPNESDVDLPWPTLAEAAGKVIPIECAPVQLRVNWIAEHRWATNWHDNPLIELQDLWDGPSPAQKKTVITELAFSNLQDQILALNHVSATNGELGNPKAYAEILNPYTLELWQSPENKRVRGVQIYDFIDESLCQALIAKNF